MCLAVPGRILTRGPDGTLMSDRRLRRHGERRLPAVHPRRRVGDYVIVHVGFALQRLDEESALRTLAEFEHLGVIKEEFGDGFELAAKQAGGQSRRRPRPTESEVTS